MWSIISLLVYEFWEFVYNGIIIVYVCKTKNKKL